MKAIKRGFTLLELMVVVTIIAILAGFLLPNIMGEPDKARLAKSKATIAAAVTALNMYKLANFNYPSTEQGLTALVSKPAGDPPANNWNGPYLDKLPKDGWEHPLQYVNQGGKIEVYSLGRDGKPGGEGMDANVQNGD